MSETKLFGAKFTFKTEVKKVITILQPNTKVHVKVDSGPRGDDFLMYLAIGTDPNGGLANSGSAGTGVQNNGKPVDVTWIIPQAGVYVFVLRHNAGDPSHPVKTVEATVNVYCDPPAVTGTVLQAGPIHEIPDPHAAPTTAPQDIKPNIVHGTGGSGTQGSGAGAAAPGSAGTVGPGAAPGGAGPTDPGAGPDKPDTSGAGAAGNTAPTPDTGANGNLDAPSPSTATPAGTTTGSTTGPTAGDSTPAPAGPDEADANLTVPDNTPGEQPSKIPTSPGGPATVPKSAPTPDSDAPVAPTPATPEPDSTLISGAGGGDTAPTDPTGTGGSDSAGTGSPTPVDPTGAGDPTPADPSGDGPPPPDPTTGDPPPPPPPEFPADWVTLVPDLLTAAAITQLGLGLGTTVAHISAGARGVVADRAAAALAGAAGAAAQVHIHEHAPGDARHHRVPAARGALPRMAFAYVLPGNAAQVVRLRDPKTGAVREIAVPPNGLLAYRAQLEREPASGAHRHDAHALLHGEPAKLAS
jgi:hypothetical protein